MSLSEQTIPEGYKQTEVGVIPEDWEILKVEDLSTKVGSGKTPTGGSSVYIESGRPFVRSQNIGFGDLRLADLVFISEETHSTFTGSEIKENDVLLNITGASIGRCAVASSLLSGGNVNQHVCIIRARSAKVTPYLLQTLINSDSGQNQIDSYQAGGNREGLNFSQIRNMTFTISSHICEQTAIANALSDIDSLLTELEKLVAKKQAIKTATMQQLLTGKTRLPQFARYTAGDKKGQLKGTKSSDLGEIPEDWKVQNISDFASKVGSGKTPTGGSSVYKESGRPFIRSQNVGVGSLNLTDMVFITEETHQTFKSSEIITNDVLLNITGASIGRCAIATKIIENGNVNQHVCIIRIKPLKVSPYLLQTLLNSDLGQKQIESFQAGGNREGLNFSQIKSLKFALSDCIAEQTAIANILSDMDTEIQALEQRLEKTKQIKQGMMQELLTGRTRLPFDKN